jgi:tetratricopeptide (TPR) repeat protein
MYFRSAEAILQGAFRREPLDVDNPMNLARLYSLWVGTESVGITRDSLSDLAMTYAEKAAAHAPGLAWITAEAATIAHLVGRKERARQLARKAVATDSLFARAYTDLARYYIDDQESDSAYTLLLGAPDRVRSIAEVQSILAGLAREKGRLEEALSHLSVAIRAEANQPELLARAMEISLELGDCVGARGYLTRMQVSGAEAAEARARRLLAEYCGSEDAALK